MKFRLIPGLKENNKPQDSYEWKTKLDSIELNEEIIDVVSNEVKDFMKDFKIVYLDLKGTYLFHNKRLVKWQFKYIMGYINGLQRCNFGTE